MKRLLRVLGGIVLGFGLLGAPLTVQAQTQSATLADLRQQLSVLGQDLVALRQELVATLPQNAPLSAMGSGGGGALAICGRCSDADGWAGGPDAGPDGPHRRA